LKCSRATARRLLACHGAPPPGAHLEHARLRWPEISLKQELVGLFVAIHVDQLRNDRHLGVAHDDRIFSFQERHEPSHLVQRDGDRF
jgi:hypothetical protein